MSDLQKIMDHVDKLGKRKASFLLMLDHLFKTPKPFVVETGCMRQEENYEGDGMSTLLWSHAVDMLDGRVDSFDINREAVEFAQKKIGKQPYARYFGHTVIDCCDSINGIRALTKTPEHKIDLLYLDSVDLELPDLHKSFIHNMFEFTTALPLLKPGSLICVDDNVPFEFVSEDGKVRETKTLSKGEYLRQYMDKIGNKPIFEDYQIIWRWK